MRRSFLLLSLSLTGSAATAGPLEAPIVGGASAAPGQFPSVVSVHVVNTSLCTGTLIAPDWVLTAAHCISARALGKPTQASVTEATFITVGTVNAYSGGDKIEAADTIPDPMYDPTHNGVHDGALVKLKTPVTTVTPSPLNFDPALAPIGVGVTMVGFGITSAGGGGAGIENFVEQTSVQCLHFVMAGSDASLLCFNQADGHGKCNGDSGGPSFAKIGGKLVQVGISSFGDPACTLSADQRVEVEKDFILQNLPLLYCDADADCPDRKSCFQHQCIVAPFEPTGIGSTCTGSGDCQSGECTSREGTSTCTMACAVGAASACPDGFDCVDMGTCWPASGGCCDTGGSTAPTALVTFALVGLVLRRPRRLKLARLRNRARNCASRARD